MSAKAPKLNSMRLLDAEKIPYDVMLVEDKDYGSAAEVAAQLGIPTQEVFKTLVTLSAVSGGKPSLVMIPSAAQLDLKLYAAAIGQKKMMMAPQDEAERLTGLKVGGIGALALVPKHWQVFLDEAATTLDRITVSAGQRGVMLRLHVQDLIRVLGATVITATE